MANKPGAIYSSRRWRKARAAFLLTHPFCCLCATIGLSVAAEDVDHVVRIEDGGAPWEERNFQAMCHSHHSIKTRADTSGKPMHVGPPRPARLKGATIDGMPIDPDHWWSNKTK